MQIRLEQLSAHLKHGLACAYVISGDEPLQTTETLDVIRQSARDSGFTERIVFHVDNQFDWNIVRQYIDNFSLFSEKYLLDIRLLGGNIDQLGTDVLVRYVSLSNPNQIMLVSTGQLNAKQRRSKWYKSLEKVGITIAIWPIDPRNLPRWIKARVLHRGITITTEAAKLLANRVEGNLLACVQEIEKFVLLGDTHEIDVQNVLECVTDSTHFESFDLVDSTLMGDAKHTVRILLRLEEEGTNPLPVLGILVWEIREIARISELTGNAYLEQVIRGQSVWYRRKKLIASALGRHDRIAWLKMLRVAECVDQIIKGTRKGDPWEGLLGLALLIVGVQTPFLSTLHSGNS
uniref:DNA polymerase III subunit delta n=1 Tax=Candidatus Kentrum sp. TUN TaxID=2126343 RepID=A0A450ZKM0_9GAMM|nr:MAG: DNA polymerase III, delta subunit [Candidatus Kentron sp. TUN]VFK56284.1 MAG: DNA polymerase III, delta subunit [Candidatus Kentron sp. TUN]